MSANHGRVTPLCAVDARVVQSTRVCREHVRIELALPEFPPSTPGQFVQLLCRETIEANTAQPAAARDGADAGIARWRADVADGFPSIVDRDFSQRRPFLRRPFSIADRWRAADGDVRLVVISRTIGAGTAWLEQLRAGDTLNLTGPLGHGFEIPVADVPVVLAGGGVGIPPLLYLARRLRELGRRDVTVVLGATTRALLPVTLSAAPAREATPSRCVELPGGAPYPALIATDRRHSRGTRVRNGCAGALVDAARDRQSGCRRGAQRRHYRAGVRLWAGGDAEGGRGADMPTGAGVSALHRAQHGLRDRDVSFVRGPRAFGGQLFRLALGARLY